MTSRPSARAASSALLCSMLALCAFAGDARAQASLTVGMGNLGYTLIDLDPEDGISPSLLPLAPPLASGDWYEGGYARARTDTGTGSVSRRDTGAEARLESLLVGEGAYSKAWVDGRGDLAAVGIGLEASTHGDGSERLYAESDAQSGYLPFILSPQTEVRFHVDAWSDGHGDAADAADAHDGERFSTQASLYVSLADEAGRYHFGSDSDHVSVPPDWAGEYDLDGTMRLEAWATNSSDNSVAGYSHFTGWAWAYTAAAPVPEPGHAALLALGLGVLGLRRRRAHLARR